MAQNAGLHFVCQFVDAFGPGIGPALSRTRVLVRKLLVVHKPLKDCLFRRHSILITAFLDG